MDQEGGEINPRDLAPKAPEWEALRNRYNEHLKKMETFLAAHPPKRDVGLSVYEHLVRNWLNNCSTSFDNYDDTIKPSSDDLLDSLNILKINLDNLDRYYRLLETSGDFLQQELEDEKSRRDFLKTDYLDKQEEKLKK